jgi:hypothetical protein
LLWRSETGGRKLVAVKGGLCEKIIHLPPKAQLIVNCVTLRIGFSKLSHHDECAPAFVANIGNRVPEPKLILINRSKRKQA